MNRKIYKQIAQKYGVSVPEVKREIQLIIDAIYQNPNATASAVPRKGDKPTPEEFIAYATQKVGIK